MAMLPSSATGLAQTPALFGPVLILPRVFLEQSLGRRLLLPMTSESSPSGPDIACLESSHVGLRLILCLEERSWLALALLNEESHEHVASLLATSD